jgi:uncharacterized protein (TIGR00251 family)
MSDPTCQLRLQEDDESVTFSVHVQPRASRNELCGIMGEAIKVRLTSPPVEGAANRLCIEFFAALLHLAKSKVTIVSGEKSRLKTLRIRGATAQDIRTLLEERP